MKQSSNHVPGRVTSRGSDALMFKLVDGRSVMLFNNKGESAAYGKSWFGAVKKEPERLQEGFGPNTKLIRRINSNTDYIELMGGHGGISAYMAQTEGELSLYGVGGTVLRQEAATILPANSHPGVQRP
ncbi:hypothetical protein N9L68_03400 [bacterium]|nr:hypothetical protein [bacterium]